MRNLHIVSKIGFVSYSINAGEYCNDVRIDNVLQALARAFGSPIEHVRQDFGNILAYGDRSDDFRPRLCASEYDVLVDLHSFLRNTARKSVWDFTSDAFVYVNLNTGISVIWTHISV